MTKNYKSIRVDNEVAREIEKQKEAMKQQRDDYISANKVLREKFLRGSKKGFIGDSLTGIVMMFAFFMLLALCIFFMTEFNSEFQKTQAPTEAKALSQNIIAEYPTMMGYLFPALFIVLFIVSLITSYLIDVISKIWVIIAIISSMIFVAVSYIIKVTFLELIEQYVFSVTIGFIPGAMLFFTYLPLIASAWTFLIALVLYIKVMR